MDKCSEDDRAAVLILPDAKSLFDADAPAIQLSTSLNTFHEAIFAGKIFCLRQVAAFAAIVEWTRGLLQDNLGTIEPEDVHRHILPSGLDEFLLSIQRGYAGSEELARLWHRFFEAAGFDPDVVTCDRFQLRFQPPADAVGAHPWRPATATIGVHRDTWATNLYSQVNWWGPVFPITAERTFGFFVDHWDRPVPNNSADFVIRDGMIKLNKSRDDLEFRDLSPTPTLPLSIDDRLPVVIDVGDVIAFSGQHLHQGVANVTDKTRISVEARTIRVSDYANGIGAPNTDGASLWTSPGMFRRVSDGQRLSDIGSLASISPFRTPHSR